MWFDVFERLPFKAEIVVHLWWYTELCTDDRTEEWRSSNQLWMILLTSCLITSAFCWHWCKWPSESRVIQYYKYKRLFTMFNPKALKYFCMNHEDQRVFSIEIIINVLVSSLWLICICSWPMAIRNIFASYIAGIDFRRQNLTSTDVRFWRLKSIPAL